MIGKHLSDEQLTDLIYGEESSKLQDVRAHLQFCESCRERYGDLSEALNWMNRLPAPELSTPEKRSMFEAAWRTPKYTRENRSISFAKSFLRHAVSFGAGLACGLILLAVAVSHTEAEVKKPDSTIEIPQPKNPVPSILSGTPAAKVYSELENPIIVVQKKEKQLQQRVMEGTLENGSVQVVWNLR